MSQIKYQSNLITPSNIVTKEIFFNIPIYQRLYVWGREQVTKLLEDLWQAYCHNEPVYYLGATLVVQRVNAEDEKYYDLIDGQQRFTTLWLMSISWQHHMREFSFKEVNGSRESRVGFSIRPEVERYFSSRLDGKEISVPEAVQLDNALEVIDNFKKSIENLEESKKIPGKNIVGFTKYIRDNVQLILTTVPEKTDLNNLFEAINNRGIQLQHHEILKAKLLEYLDSKDRLAYSQLWEACAFMDGYVERNLRKTANVNVLGLFTNKNTKTNEEELACAAKVLENLEGGGDSLIQEPWSLREILTTTNELNVNGAETVDLANDLEEERKVESIISFSMLLQHTLRIYLLNKHHPDIDRVSDKDLLNIFDKSWLKSENVGEVNAEQIKAFIRLLWNVRYQFDKHIVKWNFDEKSGSDDKHLMLRNLRNNSGYLQRETEATRDVFSNLQSMLYHSQELVTQYWLTPMLNYLVFYKGGDGSTEKYLAYLDNQMFCTDSALSLLKRSRQYTKTPFHFEDLIRAEVALGKSYDNGTQYPHYWFYKLEYILYLDLKNSGKKQSWVENYRITAKNSVEHISPQSLNRVETMHDFGNLALVSRNINSEFSDKSFAEKRAYFKDKHHNKGVSLKLEYVYEFDQWTDTEIVEHKNKMVEKFQNYLDSEGLKAPSVQISKIQHFISAY